MSTDPAPERDSNHATPTNNPGRPATEPLPDPPTSLWPVFVKAIVGVVLVVVVAGVGVSIYKRSFPDRYVVDFYPADEKRDRPPTAVIRWPACGVQLPPVELPAILANDRKWNGVRPKRAELRADTILPAGEVLEYHESPPPGRYLIQLGPELIDVHPEADWSRGNVMTDK